MNAFTVVKNKLFSDNYIIGKCMANGINGEIRQCMNIRS